MTLGIAGAVTVLDGLPLPIDVLAPSALAGLAVLLVFTGRLLPRSTVDRIIAQKDRQIEDLEHDRNEWRTAHRISETGRQEERDHNVSLVNDIAKPLTAFLQGFRRVTDSEGDSS